MKKKKKSNFHLAPLFERLGLKRVVPKEWEEVDGTEIHIDKETGREIETSCKVLIPKQ